MTRYGTIGPVSDHRIRLTDEDIAEITSALRARAAMRGAKRRTTMLRLADRLDEGMRGNPNFRLGGVCPHGELGAAGCLRCAERKSGYAAPANPAGQPTSPQAEQAAHDRAVVEADFQRRAAQFG